MGKIMFLRHLYEQAATEAVKDAFLPGVSILYRLAVVYGFEAQHLRVWDCIFRDENGTCSIAWSVSTSRNQSIDPLNSHRLHTDRAAPIQAFTEAPLSCKQLHRPRTDVVTAGISQNIVQGLVFRDILASLANHNTQLGLIVGRTVLRSLWHWNCSRIRARQGTPRLGEENGRLGERHICFLSNLISVGNPIPSLSLTFAWSE